MKRGRPKKQVVVVVQQEENPTKFTRTYEDEYSVETWTFDLNRTKNGPVSIDIQYKTGAEKKLKQEAKELRKQKKIAREMKKINKKNENRTNRNRISRKNNTGKRS